MISTYGVKYIGSKNKLLPDIAQVIEDLVDGPIIDVFTGTTRVAQYLRQLGHTVSTSDLSWASTAYAYTYVHNGDFSHLETHLAAMNTGQEAGWLTANYCGEDSTPYGRCFQKKNTMKADHAMEYIHSLDLSVEDRSVLTTSVIRGLDAVDNTVGIQQAYLKDWCSRSFKDVVFELPVNISGPTGKHYEGDCLTIDYEKASVAYLDPPYSPHSYSTYYHIWDSIARWDKPSTSLKSRRRDDRVTTSPHFNGSMVSSWNSKKTAERSFHDLISRLPVENLVISYSDESLISQDSIVGICKAFGKVEVHEIDYRRNIMSQIGNATLKKEPEVSQKNKELIITIKK